MEDFEYDRLQHYIEIGAVSVDGIDEEGEFIFSLTEKAKDLAPELWKIHTEYVDSVLLDFFERGLVDVSYNEDLEATFNLTEEAKSLIKEFGLSIVDKDSND